jgi:hypothetical protein
VTVADQSTVADPASPHSDPAGALGQPARGLAVWRSALLFVLPFLLLGAAWMISNPPGAAPDEPDHLIKAIGLSHFDFGYKYDGPSQYPGLVGDRNASLSRVIKIPAELNPDGFTCYAFEPAKTASCLPTSFAKSGTVDAIDPIGSYPPFLYFPIGWAAAAMHTPPDAFYAGRAVVLLLSSLLLLVGAWQLVRWLGRWALVGAYVGFSPMAVFCTSIVSTSGFEICGAFGVAAVVISVSRNPAALRDWHTHLVLGISGTALILSRQLGIVTFVLLMLVAFCYFGWRPLWHLVRRPSLSLVLASVVLIVSGIALLISERQLDHPSHTGTIRSAFHLGPIRAFRDNTFEYLRMGIGLFGWLDARMPGWSTSLWIMLLVSLMGAALLFGETRDRWAIVVVTVVVVFVAFITYATVFYTVAAGLQGRHLIPMFLFVPMLAGIVVIEKLAAFGSKGAVRRLLVTLAVCVPLVQWTSLYWNGHRYAVGSAGRTLFISYAQWTPPGGWELWLAVGLVGALAMGASIFMSGADIARAGISGTGIAGAGAAIGAGGRPTSRDPATGDVWTSVVPARRTTAAMPSPPVPVGASEQPPAGPAAETEGKPHVER